MAKHGWSGPSEAELRKRVGKSLGVEFGARPMRMAGGSRADMAKIGDEAWVAVHIERKRDHPVENVLQYWPWLERNRRRLVLVHVIASDADRRPGGRADLTAWLGAMMERVIPGRFDYCRVEIGSLEEGRQLEAATAAIASLKEPMEGRSLIHGA